MNIQSEIVKGATFLAGLDYIARFALIGSAMYLPYQAQDVDFAVLLKPEVSLFEGEDYFLSCGFVRCSEYDKGVAPAIWTSVRKGNLNLMLTTDEAWLDRYLTAMEVCKLLGIAEKSVRIAICQIVRDGVKADETGSDLA